MVLDNPERLPMLPHFHIWESFLSPLSSLDSGLEAFSRHPTHGSFSALNAMKSKEVELDETNQVAFHQKW